MLFYNLLFISRPILNRSTNDRKIIVKQRRNPILNGSILKSILETLVLPISKPPNNQIQYRNQKKYQQKQIT